MATRRAKSSRASAWWREPIPFDEMQRIRRTGASDAEIAVLIAQERALKIARLKEKIQDLRKFSNAFTPSKGYTLTAHNLARLHPARLKKLEDAHRLLRNATSRPYFAFAVRSKAQRDAAIRLAGEILPEQKAFILHPSIPDKTELRWSPTAKEFIVVTKAKGTELYDAIFRMPRKPRSWKEVRNFTKSLIKRGLPDGRYRLFTDLYGQVGTTYTRNQLLDGIDYFFSTYDKFMAGTVMGWVWISSSLEKARSRMTKERTLAEKFQEARIRADRRKQHELLERLGKLPKKKRKKSKKKKLKKKAVMRTRVHMMTARKRVLKTKPKPKPKRKAIKKRKTTARHK